MGETTAGGSHPVGPHKAGDHFIAYVPNARSISPVTKTDWEGKGVIPDVAVSAENALETAERLAEEKIQSNSSREPRGGAGELGSFLLRPQTVYSNSRMIRVLGTVFAAMLGLAFGSFLNVCLSRWPQGESIVHPRSHCRRCGRTLAWWENIPLVSWIALRGRCRGCGAWIGWRYVLVECAVAAVWSLLAWRSMGDFVLSPETAIRGR